MKNIINIFIILIIILSISCSSLLSGLSESLYMQKDTQLVKDGAPSYLLLIEGLIHSNPKKRDYLMLGIQLFSAYAGAFVKDEDRKKIFSDKTKEWSVLLLRTYPKFVKYESAEFNEYEKWVDSLKKSDIPYVFWAANAWIMWIIENSDDMNAMLELPRARVIIDKIYEMDPSYYFGAPHLFYGIYYSILPEFAGGDLEKAKEEFNKALEYSKDKFLLTKLSYAEFYLKAKYDRDNYIKVLKEIVNTDLEKNPEMRLLNTLTQEQAKELLKNVNNFFYQDDF